MKKITLILLVFASNALLAQNQTKFEKIDSYLHLLETNNKFMGSLAIREGNTLVFSKAYGVIDSSNNILANSKTKYKIGSITKTFTATIALQLVEEKKLNLNTLLSDFYPEIKNANKITIEQLLYQRTGIPDYLNADTTVAGIFKKTNARELLLDKIKNYESLFQPNSKFEYSNSNYYLLGEIIEKVTKKTFKENLEKRIVSKIGLRNTSYPEGNASSKTNESVSFIFNGEKWEKMEEWQPDLAFAAGAMVSTPEDLTQFMKALFDGKLVKPKSLELMKTLQEGYGMALIQFPFGERKFFGHTGGIEGFRANVGYYPTEDLSVSLIVNGENTNRNDIMIGILSMYYKIPFPMPNFEKLEGNLIKAYSGTYISTEIPIKITVFEKNGELMAQATGQSAFELTMQNEKTFIFSMAGVEITFGTNSFVLKQGGQKFNFTKE